MKWAGMAAALSQQYSPDFLGVLAPSLARARALRAPLPRRRLPLPPLLTLYPGSKFTKCFLIPIKLSFPPLTFPPTHPPQG